MRLLFLLLFGALAAHAQDAGLTYQMPAPELAALVDAPRTPSVSLSPDRATMAFFERDGSPDIALLAQDELGLAGVRVNPATTGPSRATASTGLAFRPTDATGDPTPVTGLPANPQIRNASWSPDGAHVAFTLDFDDRIELWVADVAARTARPWIDRIVSDAAPGATLRWLPSSDGVVVRTIPRGRGPMPRAATIPTGPVIREARGEAAAARTYQDLLQNPHDEALFDHFMTSELVVAGLDGSVRPIGEAAVVTGIDPSPDGRYLLVETLERPYSYLVPASRFPTTTQVHDLSTGDVVHTVARLPLAENIPIAFGSTREGRRSIGWRADAPATLFWAEAQDGGDAAASADIRDRLFLHAAPFADEPKAWTDLPLRYAGLIWGDDDTAIVYESQWQTRQQRTYRLRPGTPAADADLLFERSFEDRYGNPGSPMTQPNEAGYGALVLDDGAIFLEGEGASPEGNRPFVRRFDLSSKATTELFRSEAPFYEQPVAFLDAPTRLLTQRETVTDPPNYVARNLATGAADVLTSFPHPYPELANIQKETITYTRADGVPLSATLYLPAGYDAQRDGPLPAFVWAYPQEFKSASAAGQRDDSPYRFTYVSFQGAVPYVTQGYAVLDDAAFPIVGEGDAEPNDTFVEQLVMNAQAVIDEGVRRGVVDPSRVAVGGHSYGAFMTANLLAHSDLFRTGIARSGAYNRTLTPFGFQREERTYWQDPDLYNRMSPFMNAAAIDEPILLIHGQADNNPGTFTLQSERLYGALKGLGTDVRLVLLPAESHGYRARQSVLHMLWEQGRWLDAHLKDAPVETSSR
jgi:dipeptidyl aminopeptidase/acylaminoacyl peptidase